MDRRDFFRTAGVATLGASTVVLIGCPTLAQWEAIVINDLPAIIQVISEIFVIAGDPSVGTELESKVQQVTNQVVADLNLINTLVANYQAHASTTLLGQIDAVLADAQTNLSALLSVFHVENPTLMATIAAVLGVAISAVTGLEVLIPPPPAPSPTRVYLAYDMGGNAVRMAYNRVVQIAYPRYMLR
jgi:hypothetical protein